ncbi:MAG: thiamine phosphate synthase, partial [Nitrospirae bacterium]|nr:thiamine phosphate synthase [Nitrospirota bacterium]
KEGADYIGFGSIFRTATKEDVILQGLDGLRKVKQSVNIPVIAIGGINADNVKSVFETGCYGVAASSGLLKGDLKENAEKFLSQIHG